MDTIEDRKMFRRDLDGLIEKFPELFPDGIHDGYWLKEVRRSKKSKIPTRRITVGSDSYTIRPSFVMPYHTALTDEVEKALFLRKFNVPFWALAHVFGRDATYWYRMEQSLGRNSIVGTTVKNPELLPEDLAADEKHSRLKGEKVYVPVTVGSQCILGAAVSKDAGETGLTEAYGKFGREALDLNPGYRPKSVNTDGWKATINAWKSPFPMDLRHLLLSACVHKDTRPFAQEIQGAFQRCGRQAMELLRGHDEGVLFPARSQAPRMGESGGGSRYDHETHREIEKQHFRLFEGLRSAWLP